jgi:hypothetical protein
MIVSLLIAAAALEPMASAPVPAAHRKTVYYLHGKIVEDLGPRGISPRFGAYDYPGILDAFRQAGFDVISEIRPKDTDPSAYADKVAAEVRWKIAQGTPSDQITIVGASKGAIIASLVSTRLKVASVHYVLLAGCNDWLLREMKPQLTGEVLSIYEASDDIGGSCRTLAEQSPQISSFEEIRLETGLGHGMLYRPIPEWVKPALAWAGR